MGRIHNKKEWESRTEKRLVCVGGNTLLFQLSCIWNPRWKHEKATFGKRGCSASSSTGKCMDGLQAQDEPVHTTGTELCSELRTGKWSWTDAASTQTLFKLKEDYTPDASTMSEWVILCHSKTLSREMLLIPSSPIQRTQSHILEK